MLLVTSLACFALAREDVVKEEMNQLQGSWKLIALELDGQKVEPDPAETNRIVIRDNKLTPADGDGFTFKIDPTTTLKIIDFTKATGDDKGRVFEGIYRLDGDRLTLCISIGEGVKARPAEFAAEPGSGRALVVLSRRKD